MKYLLCLTLFWLVAFSQLEELNLPVKDLTCSKLSLSLQRLVHELEFFRTPFENKSNLYKRVTQTQFYLQELTAQVTDYDNTIRGKSNSIKGKNNVIVGSFNTVKGSNNYVFIQKYKGQANGDLLIGKWRIEIEKKHLILINSSLAISFINDETKRRYFRFLTEDRKSSIGSVPKENTITVVKQDNLEGAGINNETSGKNFQNKNAEKSQEFSRNQSQGVSTNLRLSVANLEKKNFDPRGTITVLGTKQTVNNRIQGSNLNLRSELGTPSNFLGRPQAKFQPNSLTSTFISQQATQRPFNDVRIARAQTAQTFPQNIPQKGVSVTVQRHPKIQPQSSINLAVWRNRS